MVKRKSAPQRQYTDEFIAEAVRLAESIGGNQAAKRLGIPESSVFNWIRKHRLGTLKATSSPGAQVKPGANELQAENERLRRELANAKLDLEIVKKAAAYFAKESR